jgi:hypothetical protein
MLAKLCFSGKGLITDLGAGIRSRPRLHLVLRFASLDSSRAIQIIVICLLEAVGEAVSKGQPP